MNIFMKICVFSLLTVVNTQNHHRNELPQSKKYIPGSDVLAKTTHRDFSRQTDGSYSYQYETSNGISGKESGMSGKSVQGSSHYVSPEGVEISLQYTADETGYHPIGDHIPKIPDYILRSLEYIRTHPYKIADSSGNVKTVTFAPNAFHQLRNQPAPVVEQQQQQQQSRQYNQQKQQQQQRGRNPEHQSSRYQQQQQREQQQQQRKQQDSQRTQRNQQQFYQQQPQQNEQQLHRRQRNNQQQQKQQSQSEQQHYQRKREKEQFEKQKLYYQEQQLSPLFSRDRSLNGYDRSQRRFF